MVEIRSFFFLLALLWVLDRSIYCNKYVIKEHLLCNIANNFCFIFFALFLVYDLKGQKND